MGHMNTCSWSTLSTLPSRAPDGYTIISLQLKRVDLHIHLCSGGWSCIAAEEAEVHLAKDFGSHLPQSQA
jgi:hypothetical protein